MSSITGLPFDDIRALLRTMPGPDTQARHDARHRQEELTKPSGSLGRLEEIAEWMAAWQGRAPTVDRPVVCVFAGNHGVAARGVSAFPVSVTQAMVENFAAGGAAINQICATYDLGLKVFDLALDVPTGDISREAAFSERDCAATMAFGMECLAGEPDLLCIGEMGIGNTAVAAAIFAALFGGSAADWVGAGTGHDAAGLQRKAAIVQEALDLHAGHLSDPLEVLRRLGGREIAAAVGAILAARMQRVPVIIDGFTVTAAAAVLHALDPSALDHCLFGHVSAERGHQAALQRMNKVPLLALGMRLGEGTGAALAAGLVKAAVACHAGMATFAQANVANRD
ncbi:nicotinate-nucleotide--dimethylbenzimidazole phosphoribosyltransferase [Aureimonas jatrophae]|uniref:Nicotinate-nucleotide--dimethylbenzimidazole phosphoribosyltransferase n=1 Tax=Aureimonas jatrophae TaxID=1166073 RepID=A0A1H0D962_9HYPH|nr:nicotinate-nucleotide--dimethylbenzimidazole phosphoribosyltransferase [Aureimonas jatrophae]MBB3951759.1 nicotinate-nucleotide--dimethylbenzimidazole phosphoribosyltransferase [Aureimonas jatrophae]SDN66496.1 nicotinate-nucleotide-dimethylbenzimidazole phosphoribosyltransferase [Aureimonas jatrophae]